jgi:iron complex outermembrane receptor protein
MKTPFNPHTRHPFRSSAATGLVAALALACTLQAKAAPQPFDLPVQPLTESVKALARQAGMTVAADDALLAGKQAPAVRGTLEPADALRQLLRGSGLEAVLNEQTWILQAAPSKPSESPTSQLPAVTVIAKRDIGQRAELAPSTTKGVTPLIQTPMSVQVVSQALIEDRQANTLREAMETVSGIVAGSTSAHEDIIVRGFPVYDSYRNGVKTRRFGPTELANAERVDVLKGPSSTQFGRGDISGLFNVVTKKPAEEAAYVLQQQLGSEQFLQTQVGATGPLNADRTLLYRVDATYEDANSYRDFMYTKRYFVAPTLSWRPDADTRLNLGLEHARNDSPIDRGIVAVGDRPANVPRERNYSEAFNEHRNESTLLAFDASHRLDPSWSLRTNLMLEQGRGSGFEYQKVWAESFFPGEPGADRTVLRAARRIDQRDVDTQYVSFELAGTPTWGGVQHDVVFGIDHWRYKGRFDFSVGDFEFIDLYEPVYAGVRPPITTHDLHLTNRSRATGLYAQDQVALTPQLNLLLGARYDHVLQTSRDHLSGGGSDTTDKKLSPRVGLVYSPTPGWSVYTGYTESLAEANPGMRPDGGNFEPVVGRQYEVGIKAESADKRLFTTLALYDLTKRNILVPDPDDGSRSIQVGEARSRGLEWDVGGRVTENWNLTASYSYTDATVTHDPVNQGKRLYGVPRHSARAFIRYDFQAGGQEGLSLGTGVVALGQREADTQNTAQLPGYGRLDLMAAYKWHAMGTFWTLQFNVENVTDRTYYLPSGSRDEIAIGKPRTLMALLRAEY